VNGEDDSTITLHGFEWSPMTSGEQFSIACDSEAEFKAVLPKRLIIGGESFLLCMWNPETKTAHYAKEWAGTLAELINHLM
jgi:hypothetical protein